LLESITASFTALNIFVTLGFETAVYAVVIFFLLFLSGLFSSSEVAFFSLNPAHLAELKKRPGGTGAMILHLLRHPKRLLATLLIANSLVNVGIVILSSVAILQTFDFSAFPVTGFVIEVVLVTFLIVLLGEVMPKIYATHKTLVLARLVATPIFVADKLFSPLSYVLVRWTAAVDKRIRRKGYQATLDDLTHAIDLASDQTTQADEKKILKGIVRFGNISVRQVMRPRGDVFALEEGMPFSAILDAVREHGYSRIPVYRGSFDTVTGILYTKDLLPHLDQDDTFRWQPLMRQPYFVPGNMKINSLLDEFREKRMHMAVVVDEYGMPLGIVSLEDVLEEIVGDISDEFDDEEPFYSRLDDDTFVFEAKTSVPDICRAMGLDTAVFGQASNLAGFLLGLAGRIPARGEVLAAGNLRFTIEASDKRRIKRVKVHRIVPAVRANDSAGQEDKR